MDFETGSSLVVSRVGLPFIRINGLTVVIVVAINLCPRATTIPGSPLCAQHDAHAACRYALERLGTWFAKFNAPRPPLQPFG